MAYNKHVWADGELITPQLMNNIENGLDDILDSNLLEALASSYEADNVYNNGDIVIYNNKMYKIIEDQVTGEWDEEKAEEIQIKLLINSETAPTRTEILRLSIANLVTLNNIAELYDPSELYHTGDYVIYNNILYRFITDSSTSLPHEFDPSQVTQVTIMDTFKSIVGDSFGGIYDRTKSYSVGDYVIYNNKIYKCVQNTTPNTFENNFEKFESTTLIEELIKINQIGIEAQQDALTAEAYACGTQDKIEITDQNHFAFKNNAKFYSDLISGDAGLVEAYTIGKYKGEDITSTDSGEYAGAFENNAKYYYEHISSALETIYANSSDGYENLIASIGDAFNSMAHQYHTGDYFVHEGRLYKCTADFTASQTWDEGDYSSFTEAVNIGDELITVKDEASSMINSVTSSIIAPEFDPEANYSAGDYTLFETEMYRFDSFHAGEWTGTDATNVSAGHEIAELFRTKLDDIYTLTASGDATDRTMEIENALASHGSCVLGPGTFYTLGIKMPDGTMLSGCGNKTKLRLTDTTYTNLWIPGDQTFVRNYQHAFATPLPPGRYRIIADITSDDTTTNKCLVSVYKNNSYGSGNRLDTVSMNRMVGSEAYFCTNEPITTIEFYASSNYSASAGDTATFANVSIVREYTAIELGSECTVRNIQIAGNDLDEIVNDEYPQDLLRNGIGYYGKDSSTTIMRGIIDGCIIHGFDGSGIKLYNTGTAVKRGVHISGCYAFLCHIGIDIPHRSEHHLVSGCTCILNGMGIRNNGGNNQFTGNNLSSNGYGFFMDSENDYHSNNSHGGMDGCIIQHSKTNALYIKDQISGFVFTGCNIDNGGIYVKNSYGILLNACNFMGAFSIEIDNSKSVNFIGNNMRTYTSSHTSITGNSVVNFALNYDYNGNLIDPSAT